VLVQADLALGRLEAGLDRPARPRHPHQLGQAGRSRRQGQVKGELVRLGEGAPDQQPLLSARGGERAVGLICAPPLHARSMRPAFPRLSDAHH
jgi:hypothetical protein